MYTSPYPGEQDKTTSYTRVKSWKDWIRNYLQPEGKLKPTHHKTITVTYNIPMPAFSVTSYKSGGKAGETKQRHSTWRKMVPSCGDRQSNLTMKVTAEPQQRWKQVDSSFQANKLQTNLLTIMKN